MSGVRVAGLLVAAALVGLGGCRERAPGAGEAADSTPARVPDTATAPVYVRYALLDEAGDTVRVERVLRGPGRLGAQMSRPGGAEEMVLEGTLDAEGRFRTLGVRRLLGPDPGRRTLHFGDTAVRVEVDGDTAAARDVAAPAGTLPWGASSVALLEQVLRRALRQGDSTAVIPVFDVSEGDGTVRDARVTWHRPDSATVRVGGSDVEVLLDSLAHVVRTLADGRRSERLR